MAAGIAVMSGAGWDGYQRFQIKQIGDRQTLAIKSRVKGVKAQDKKMAELRRGLDKFKDAPYEERCMYEKDFNALLVHGSKEEADKAIARESFVPYDNCTPWSQFWEAVKPHTFLGLGAFLVGFFGLFYKKEDPVY